MNATRRDLLKAGAAFDQPTDLNGRKVYELKAKQQDLDDVTVFNAQGKPLAFLSLPERYPNLVFGAPKGNRLYTAASHSLSK